MKSVNREALCELLEHMNSPDLNVELNEGIFSYYVMTAVKPHKDGTRWFAPDDPYRDLPDTPAPWVARSLDAIDALTREVRPNLRLKIIPQEDGGYAVQDWSSYRIGLGRTEALARCALLIKVVHQID